MNLALRIASRIIDGLAGTKPPVGWQWSTYNTLDYLRDLDSGAERLEAAPSPREVKR